MKSSNICTKDALVKATNTNWLLANKKENAGLITLTYVDPHNDDRIIIVKIDTVWKNTLDITMKQILGCIEYDEEENSETVKIKYTYITYNTEILNSEVRTWK